DMIGRIDQQAIVAERLQNGCGLWRRLGSQLADCRRGLRKFVVEKFRQRVVNGVGAGGACEREQRQDAERAKGAQPKATREIMSGETTGVRRRHDSPFGPCARSRSVLIGRRGPPKHSRPRWGVRKTRRLSTGFGPPWEPNRFLGG